MIIKKYRKGLITCTACSVLLLLSVCSLILYHYRFSQEIFSQLLESVKIPHLTKDAMEISKDDIGVKKTSHTNKAIQVSPPVSATRTSSLTVDVFNEAFTTQDNAATVANSNTVGTPKSETVLRQEVTALLKSQLELNSTETPFSVTKPCQPKSIFACVHQNCTQLSNNITERVQSLISQKTVLTQAQDDLLRSISVHVPENDVILLSAASSNHYDEMQAMLHNLHSKVFPELSKRENFSLVLWDIGLTSEQRQKVEKCCHCQVMSFPFEKFSNGTRDLHCFMWKPLMIRITLFRARKYVVYQDASIRYNSFPGLLFEKGWQLGLQLRRKNAGGSISHRTLPETFAYLGQKVCHFYPFPEVNAAFGVYKHDPFILRVVTNLWARCAFEKSCMCPRPSMPSLACHYGPCHRMDQSALSIITATLYGSEIYRIIRDKEEISQYLSIRRKHIEVDYFNSTGCVK